MRVLFIQQDPYSPTGPIGEAFADRGYDVSEFEVVPHHVFPSPHHDAVVFPDPLDYDCIVPMGAIWAVYDHHTIGWIADELRMLRTAHEAGIPMLGICFGGQAIAQALGGSVALAPEGEVGWHRISSDRPDLVDEGPWFEWHQDRWTPPPGATTIARTDRADQSFIIGRSLALQFHPELTPSTLAGWFESAGVDSLVEKGHNPDELIAETEALADDATARARRLVHRFIDQVASTEVRA